MSVGIEDLNVYGGCASVDVRELFQHRGLDLARIDNLMMQRKAVALPCEDAVTCAVNAAKPIVDRLDDDDKQQIEMLITATESGIDFGKSLSTYVHDYLGLGRNCRLFEVKQACYGGTAALQMAVHYVAANLSPGAKVLVVATDAARYAGDIIYAEPSQGVGAVALLVSDRADVLEVDLGAFGCYSRELMDGCRPAPDVETGDPDLSLLSYLECLEHSFAAYCAKVEGASYLDAFDYLAFHTPFAGMVKGAHQRMMRKLAQATPAAAESDFARRVAPSLRYCVQIGNVYSATLYVALCGLIEEARPTASARVGLFSYGSGCASEFFSGVIASGAAAKLAPLRIADKLAQRRALSMSEYERLLQLNRALPFGVQHAELTLDGYADLYQRTVAGRGLLALKSIRDYHRVYAWT
jgi:polyketide biosynthesis 3-hydroxy-3-methylglutaryl-CoA synthase-like enzyme PksG